MASNHDEILWYQSSILQGFLKELRIQGQPFRNEDLITNIWLRKVSVAILKTIFHNALRPRALDG